MLKQVAKRIFGDPNERKLRGYYDVADDVNALEPEIQQLTDDQIRDRATELKQRHQEDHVPLDDLMVEAFALVREASVRTIGLRHYDVQIIGGVALHEGKIAEMKTGEGKTLVATLPMFLNALTGKGVHLVTPNDYLSKVGVQQMGPVYHFLGVTCAVIQSSAQQRGSFIYDPDYQSNDSRYQHLRPISRSEAYRADITYGTNNEFGFDYLRDNMVLDPDKKVQRNHIYAIVDEIDNILIDEARTPLIISGTASAPSDLYRVFSDIVRPLKASSDESVELEEPDGDYVYDLKTKTVYLTEEGVEKVERAFKRTGRMEGDNLYSPDNSHALPYLDNALRAKVAYHRDKDYIVDNGQVVIVDEFTGRLMHGRRFSEGLHQAIEAKENVEVQRENLTLGTITFQNFFRMYDKLAGMTGTAATASNEFHMIYSLDVVVIPTHRPVIREDYEDSIYITEEAKWKAVVEDIRERTERGQPVLVGTVAVETSEHLGKLLKKAKIDHEVLNAKQHFREAAIIAQAGRPGAVTIATNMAGRGVDILLGGNPEGLAREELTRQGLDLTELEPGVWEKAFAEAKEIAAKDRKIVLEAGGLYVLGTERHDARSIDDQLRGRSGRQGDPGASRFYLSLEDNLMRRFGAERVKGFLMRFAGSSDHPIEHRWISNSIAQAQNRVEGYYFDMRKRVLEYDDVVNKQRQATYKQRDEILYAKPDELRERIHEMIADEVNHLRLQYLLGEDPEGWDVEELYRQALTIYPVPEHIQPETLARLETAEDIEVTLVKGALEAYQNMMQDMDEIGGPEQMAEIERSRLLLAIDNLWVRHLTDLDMLREGIGLQAIRQRDPLVEYKIEAFKMWEAMQEEIQSLAVRNIFRAADAIKQQQRRMSNIQESRPVITHASGGSSSASSKPEPVRATPKDKIGRNDPCWCGSGKKYKHCHYRADMESTQLSRPSGGRHATKSGGRRSS
ncbi:MAG: preprotein translocase subunit SecA [Chloroflexi bacterium]|nr:preprotein translocase subunit SecA [Chloroflexota bacterium]